QPTREALIQDLRGVLRADRVTTVLVTHHRGEALALGDRLAVMIGGRILQIGPAGEVFRAPTLEAVARFVGLETILDARVVEAGRRGAGGGGGGPPAPGGGGWGPGGAGGRALRPAGGALPAPPPEPPAPRAPPARA